MGLRRSEQAGSPVMRQMPVLHHARTRTRALAPQEVQGLHDDELEACWQGPCPRAYRYAREEARRRDGIAQGRSRCARGGAWLCVEAGPRPVRHRAPQGQGQTGRQHPDLRRLLGLVLGLGCDARAVPTPTSFSRARTALIPRPRKRFENAVPFVHRRGTGYFMFTPGKPGMAVRVGFPDLKTIIPKLAIYIVTAIILVAV
eukprot:470764-Prymnesium_polylepis.1